MDKLIKIIKRKDDVIFGNFPYQNIDDLYDKKHLIDIPEKIIIKKLTNGSITNQIIENPVIYPNSMRPNNTCGP